MPNKPSYYERANFLKRRRRRPDAIESYDAAPSFRKCPSIAELKDALRAAKGSTFATIRLVALMDNLAAFHSPRFVFDGDGCDDDTNSCKGRTSGVRRFLAQDGYLVSRYATLTRYKRLAERIRLAAGIGNGLIFCGALNHPFRRSVANMTKTCFGTRAMAITTGSGVFMASWKARTSLKSM